MTPLPREAALDSTIALFADPYRFISRRCRHYGTPAFQARILGSPTLCLSGPAAASLFYDPRRFQRAGAAPEPLRATLFGKTGVQTLDGALHRRRKQLFLRVLTEDAVAALADSVERHWHEAARQWGEDAPVTLYSAAHGVLTRSVCEWAGVPLNDQDAPLRTRQLVSLFDGAARGLIPHMRSRFSRKELESWLAMQIDVWRRHPRNRAPRDPIGLVAEHEDIEGRPLPASVAAVELLNILRPVVAVSVFIVFGVHALYFHPQWRDLFLGHAGHRALGAFLNEVRRYYPFFPAVMARVIGDFEWNGYPFRQGQRVLLDLYGTNHDPSVWLSPDAFDPLRFERGHPPPFGSIPQGGGNVATGHRCPGEDVALAVMARSLGFLVRYTRFTPTSQDAELDFQRLPALPRARFAVEPLRRRSTRP